MQNVIASFESTLKEKKLRVYAPRSAGTCTYVHPCKLRMSVTNIYVSKH